MAEVKTKFRPEFLNRIDEIIVFHRLKREQMGRDRRHPDRAARRSCWPIARSRSTLDDTARTWLANQGYDPAYGARPLKRVIQRNVQDPLAEAILAGTSRTARPCTSRWRPASSRSTATRSQAGRLRWTETDEP